jgi:hypothetical protein
MLGFPKTAVDWPIVQAGIFDRSAGCCVQKRIQSSIKLAIRQRRRWILRKPADSARLATLPELPRLSCEGNRRRARITRVEVCDGHNLPAHVVSLLQAEGDPSDPNYRIEDQHACSFPRSPDNRSTQCRYETGRPCSNDRAGRKLPVILGS